MGPDDEADAEQRCWECGVKKDSIGPHGYKVVLTRHPVCRQLLCHTHIHYTQHNCWSAYVANRWPSGWIQWNQKLAQEANHLEGRAPGPLVGQAHAALLRLGQVPGAPGQ